MSPTSGGEQLARLAMAESLRLQRESGELDRGVICVPIPGAEHANHEEAPMDDIGDRRRIKFDPTVNLGHILTFVGFIAAGFGAYGLVDKRITVLEVQAARAMQDNTAQREELKGVATQMREDVKDLRRSIDELIRSTNRKEDRR